MSLKKGLQHGSILGGLALGLAFTASAASACAKEVNFQEVILDNTYIAYERDVGDVNGDGANDLICVTEGPSSTNIVAFLAPSWTRRTLLTTSGPYRYPRADDFKVRDMDNDGDLDLVTRLGLGPLDDGPGIAVWYENLGGGTSWVQHVIGNSPEYVKDIVVVDFDRDGRLDVAMRMDSRTQIWLQETNGWTEVMLNHEPHEGMEAADADMDGDPDLVLNGFWFATPNTPAACRSATNWIKHTIDAAWFTHTGDWTANSCKVAVADIDGDGTNDVAFSHSERPGYAVAWYRSSTPNGAGPWSKQPVTILDYCHTLQAADWDLDGDVDLLVGGMTKSQHRGLKLMLNNGTGMNWAEFIIQTNGSYSAEIGDMDNDGDLDIVGIRNWDAAPSYLYRSNAGGGGPEELMSVGQAIADDAAAGETDVRGAGASTPRASGVRLTENAVDESAGGVRCYKIETPTATYFLEKVGAGLSSLIDKDGHDWLGYNSTPGSRAGGEFRGFPNAVHQQAGSYFHPKNAGTDPSTTKVEQASPERVSISAVSSNGLWACRYDFFPTHCTFTMTRMPPDKKYWVLYEGAPGGQFDATDWWMTSAMSQPKPMTQPHEGDIPAPEWIVFGDAQLSRVLFLLHHEDDGHPDRFYQMEMKLTVFGFGRQGLGKFLDHVPQSVSIGFLETTNHTEVGRALDKLPRPASTNQ